MVFGDKNLDMYLSHEIKSFDLKNIRSVFLRTKKCFLITEKLDMFCSMKKKVVFGDKNSDLCLLYKIKSFGLRNIRSVF